MDICTVIAKNYVAQARVLARSFREHHPDATCHVLVLDEYEGHLDPAEEPFALLTPDDLAIDDFERMAAVYDVLELSTAVKPWLMRMLLDRDGVETITYIDPDIEIFAPLDEVERLAREHGLVLIPHVTEPMPRDGKKPSETDILIAGVYNLGFIGLGRGAATDELLEWWSERLAEDCRVDPERGYFVDQRWMDFAPGIVPDLAILRDPGYDVAYWNLPNRTLGREDGGYTVNGRPLRFFHYSGYDPDRSGQLSKHQDRIVLREDPVLAELCDAYGRALLENGYRESKGWTYTYDRLGDGTQLDRTMRRLLPAAIEEGAVRGSVFEEEPARDFLAWLARPAETGAEHGINRYLAELHDRRPDLQRTYPDLGGPDGAGFAGWARAYGAEEVPIPKALLPPKPRAEAPVKRAARPPAELDGLEDRWGVNVIGYLRSELGVGEAARQVITGMDACGVPVAPVGLVAPLSRQGHTFSARERPEYPYGFNVVCVNADGLPAFVGEVGTDYRRDRYTIGMWFWEVSTFPDLWKSSFDFVDEVWVATEHIAQALEPLAPTPVTKVTVPIAPVRTGLLTRERLGLPDGLLFMFAFDYNSVFARKNPLGLIDAFTRAFPRPGEATLVIKSINHEKDRVSHDELRAAAAERPDVLLVDRYVSLQEKNSMIAACDCYVSLHRSEGLGLTMGEAMSYGRPVIATGYSGNLDFMTEDNSLLVRHRLVPIGVGADPYPPDGEWAEPDLDHAAEHLRWVADHPADAAALGRRGQDAVRETHSPRAAGRTMVRRLDELRPLVPKRKTTGPLADALLGNVGTAGVREQVRKGPEDAAASAPRDALRKAVLRTMRPYTVHQQDVDHGILSIIEDHLGASGRGFEALRRHALLGDTSLLTQLRALEQALRGELAAVQSDLAARVDRALAQVERHETRLSRLEPDSPRLRRWPPQPPWSEDYLATHRSFVAAMLDDPALIATFAEGRRLPPDYGVGLDERVVEYPWVFAQQPRGRMLDAGSTFNHVHLLERLIPRVDELVIATLVTEEQTFPQAGVRYDEADVRELPYEDGAFDTVACISTLEHVGMDNKRFGADVPPADDPLAAQVTAARELRRVVAPGGRLLLTMPFGEAQDGGWYRQFDETALDAILEALRPAELTLTVVRYTEAGWQRSSREEAAASRYHDHVADPSPDPDHAAAARAVACVAARPG